MVAVAQLVESRIVIPVVVGSSPISHPKNSSKRPSFRTGPFAFHCKLGAQHNRVKLLLASSGLTGPTSQYPHQYRLPSSAAEVQPIAK